MELQHVNVKIFIEDPEAIELEKATPIFHHWIQEQNGDELLIDVADYLHVPEGPGIVLIGKDADYSLDETPPSLGLRYNRKAGLDGGNEDRFAEALRGAMRICEKLSRDPNYAGKLKFDTHQFQLIINDRALAPNTEKTWNECKNEIETFVKKTFPNLPFRLEWNSNRRELFGAMVRFEKAFDIVSTLAQLR